MDYMKLAELLFPHITKTPEEYEDIYPDRKLPEGARVTRLAAKSYRIHTSGKSLQRICQ